MTDPNPTSSPFWLSVNGSWLRVEGIVPTVDAAPSRPRSSITSLDGHRFEQRGSQVRRSWSWSIPWAAIDTLGLVTAAVESQADVWLWSEATINMLTSSTCFGAGPVLDCGGVPLPAVTEGVVLQGSVRGGKSTTLSWWSSGSGADAVTLAGPGVAALRATTAGQNTYAFTPNADGVLSFGAMNGAPDTSGFMLTEGTPPEIWSPGESMPCKVVVDDPEETLTMRYQGTWLRDFTVALREVG